MQKKAFFGTIHGVNLLNYGSTETKKNKIKKKSEKNAHSLGQTFSCCVSAVQGEEADARDLQGVRFLQRKGSR